MMDTDFCQLFLQVKERDSAADPPVLAPPAAEVTLPAPPPAIMQPEGMQTESPAPSAAPMQPEPPLTEMAAPSPAASEPEPLLAEMLAPPTIVAEPETPPAEDPPAEDEDKVPRHSQPAVEDTNPNPSVHTTTRCDSELEADEEVSGGLPGGRSPSPPPHPPTLGQGGSVPSAGGEGGVATAARPTPGPSRDAPVPLVRFCFLWNLPCRNLLTSHQPVYEFSSAFGSSTAPLDLPILVLRAWYSGVLMCPLNVRIFRRTFWKERLTQAWLTQTWVVYLPFSFETPESPDPKVGDAACKKC